MKHETKNATLVGKNKNMKHQHKNATLLGKKQKSLENGRGRENYKLEQCWQKRALRF